MDVDMGRDGRQDTAELVHRPTRADILAGVRLRERRRRLHLVRWGLTGLFGTGAVLVVTSPESSAFSFVAAVFCAAWIWSIPHLQAHHALRTVAWQGEYRTSVGEAGIATETEHVTLVQRWSVFRGYHETRDHVVLLSRDPNILLVEVLPKRGLRSPQDGERLLALVGRHLPRV
ncbi:YcxB family protein [Streptomyces ferrugineus]|uniref:YcxB family protein n=2 Tax=Streptomyces ferrugineus TaxID=1413221 RepID=A0A7M2T148_9ACTN|nr:YcxB family protein [Streptomyces ferrugineus]